MECDIFVFEILASSLIKDLSQLIEQNLVSSTMLLNHDKKKLLISFLVSDEKNAANYFKENEVCWIKTWILFKRKNLFFN